MEQEQVKQLIRDVLNEQRAERIRISEQQRAIEVDKKVEALYLMSFGQHVFLPDSKGRAIGTMAIYAKVRLDPDHASFYNGPVSVVAHGDGRVLEEPFTMLITGHMVLSMVQVPDSILSAMTKE